MVSKSEEYQELGENTRDTRENQETVKDEPSSRKFVEDLDNCYDQLPQVEEDEVVKRPRLENMNTEDIAEPQEDGEYEWGEAEDYEDGDDWSLPVTEESETALGGMKKHICPYCQKRYSRSYDRNRHVKTVHFGERPHQCPHCNRAFGRSSHLNSHIKTQHQA